MDTFWTWLVKGSGGSRAGINNVWNKFILVHISSASLATYLMIEGPFTFATKALFPAASILIGMSMAWTTRASTILQTKELRDALFSSDRPAEDYVYGFQLSILIVIIMVVYVSIMAGGGIRLTVFGERWDGIASAFWLYFVISLALRECWGVVNFTNMLSMLEYRRPK